MQASNLSINAIINLRYLQNKITIPLTVLIGYGVSQIKKIKLQFVYF